MFRSLALTACLVLPASPVLAASFAGTTAGGLSASSGSTSSAAKQVRQARDDAAAYVASDGRIRGARLEAALRSLRETGVAARRASDMELARAILAQ